MRVKSCIIFLLVSFGLSAQSLTLEQCIARAIESSLQVKQGEQELASRRIQYNQARSDLLPTISGSVGQNWIFGKSIGADNVYHSNNSSQTTFSLNANLLLWDGLGMKYRIDMAKAQLQAQALSVEELQQDIRINICAMYLQVLLNKELLIVAENQQEDTRLKVERMQALVDANRMAAGELYSLQAQQAKEEYAVTQAQGNVMLSLLDLAQAMEEDYSPDFDIIMSAGEPIEGTLIPNNAEVYAYALEHRPDMQSLSSAESRVRLAEVILNNTQQVFTRDSALYIKKVIAQEDYDKSLLTLAQAKEELQNAIDNLSIVKEGVTAAAKESGNTIVRSSITGTILEIPVKVGNSVQSVGAFSEGTTIAIMADMADMLFVGKMDETEVGKLHVGMPMELIIGALGDQRFLATLEYIAPKGTESNGAMMFEIKGALQNTGNKAEKVRIRSGYSANAEIVLESRRNVLTLAESAVHITMDSTYVELLTDPTNQQQVETKIIQTGMSDGLDIEIVSGLGQDDIIRGQAKVQ